MRYQGSRSARSSWIRAAGSSTSRRGRFPLRRDGALEDHVLPDLDPDGERSGRERVEAARAGRATLRRRPGPPGPAPGVRRPPGPRSPGRRPRRRPGRWTGMERPSLPGDLPVEVQEAPSQLPGQRASHRRLAGGHEPHQEDPIRRRAGCLGPGVTRKPERTRRPAGGGVGGRNRPLAPRTSERYASQASKFRRISATESPPNFSRKASATTRATMASATTAAAGTAQVSLRSVAAGGGAPVPQVHRGEAVLHQGGDGLHGPPHHQGRPRGDPALESAGAVAVPAEPPARTSFRRRGRWGRGPGSPAGRRPRTPSRSRPP
jgi:hypothetical protein